MPRRSIPSPLPARGRAGTLALLLTLSPAAPALPLPGPAGEDETELAETVAAFREDEIAHRDTGLAHGAEQAPAYGALSQAVKAGTRLAIWLSERV